MEKSENHDLHFPYRPRIGEMMYGAVNSRTTVSLLRVCLDLCTNRLRPSSIVNFELDRTARFNVQTSEGPAMLNAKASMLHFYSLFSIRILILHGF